VPRRLRYIIEGSACMFAAAWLTVELTGQAEDGFAPHSALHPQRRSRSSTWRTELFA